MAKTWREWEKPLIELEEGIRRLRVLQAKAPPDRASQLEREIREFERKRDAYLELKYNRLGPWERTLISRAETRPYTLDYIRAIVTDWIELHGDRRYGDDKAMIGGIGKIDGKSFVIVGHQKGRDLKERQFRNFGMAKPEGYRKAIRLFQMADRFGLPVLSFIDTPAADPGVESESRGISQAIAEGMFVMFGLRVPTIAVIIGEGGSGGAIGIGACSRVLMLENSIYSVIPPEGCAAILWRQPSASDRAASALKLTAQHALELGIIDEIIPEAFGGAHRRPSETASNIEKAVIKHLGELSALLPEELIQDRYEKYRRIGSFEELILTSTSPPESER